MTPVPDGVIQALIGATAGGGLAGTYLAIRKTPVQTGQISVSAAEGALVVQTGVIEHLNSMMKDLDNRLVLATARIVDLEIELRTVKRERDHFEREAADLRNQVERLESHVAEIDKRKEDLGASPEGERRRASDESTDGSPAEARDTESP